MTNQKGKKCKIGITILKENKKILDSLIKSKKIATIVLYSDHKINGFETKVFPNEKAIGKAIITDYKERKIDQFVRGHVNDFYMVDEFKKQFEIPAEEKRLCVVQLQNNNNDKLFFTMVSNPEGQTLKEKIQIAEKSCQWMKDEFGISPRVAVMATCRPESVGKDPLMTKSYEDAEYLVKHLKRKGYKAKNINIELQSVLPWANLLIPSNGTIGNQIIRSLAFFAKWKNLSSPSIFSKGSYGDNSRNETDLYSHILFASHLAKNKK